MATVRKTRNANFTSTEFKALVDGVEKYKSVVLSKLCDISTKPKKDAVWSAITANVNSSCRYTCERTVKEIKKKWNDTKSRTKKRAAMARANPDFEPRLSTMEERILGFIDTSSNGVDEGTDTDDATLPPTTSAIMNSLQSAYMQQPDDDSAYTTVYVEEDDVDPPKPIHIPETAVPTPYQSLGDKILVEKLVAVKKARLEIERERLEVEKARLQVEQKRLKLEEKRLILKEKKFCYL